MGAPQAKPSLSIEDALVWEAHQPQRHEYLQGEVSRTSVGVTLTLDRVCEDVQFAPA